MLPFHLEINIHYHTFSLSRISTSFPLKANEPILTNVLNSSAFQIYLVFLILDLLQRPLRGILQTLFLSVIKDFKSDDNPLCFSSNYRFYQDFVAKHNLLYTNLLLLIEVETEHIALLQMVVIQVLQQLSFAPFIVRIAPP